MANTKVGPFGGTGGNAWDDGGYTTIRQFHICSGTVIDSIEIEYDNNGQSVWSPKHGGTGGVEHKIVLDYPNEFITGISGYHSLYNTNNYVIFSIKIQTNKTTYGPFGTETGNSFAIPSSSGRKILGFFGRSGTYVDAIGAYVSAIPIPIGPFGGTGGTPWNDDIHTDIKQVHVYSGSVVDAIQVEYVDNGTVSWATKHGGTGGDKHEIALNYPNEYITGISGHVALYNNVNYVVNSLTISTNQTTYGPFGTTIGNTFSVPSTGSKIVGFLGRAGTYVDAIGVYMVPSNKGTVGPFGGSGGSSFDDGINTSIKQIEINSGEVIDSFRIEYLKDGAFVWSDKHGESTGGGKSVIKLDDDETVWSISGHYNRYTSGVFTGDVVSSLTFKTNQETYGPFGKEDGTPFVISGAKVVGLFGKSGVFIDSLGGYVV